MLSRRKRGEVAQATADRRRREDEAPRLREGAPSLVSLDLAIEERRPSSATRDAGHTRRIVVDRAPALFVMPCAAPGCTGEHDITRAVMQDLDRGATRFEGECQCDAC